MTIIMYARIMIYETSMKTKKEFKHIYIFDYSCGKIFHDKIEKDKDWEEYLAESNFNMDEVYCMVTNDAICIEEINTKTGK